MSSQGLLVLVQVPTCIAESFPLVLLPLYHRRQKVGVHLALFCLHAGHSALNVHEAESRCTAAGNRKTMKHISFLILKRAVTDLSNHFLKNGISFYIHTFKTDTNT